MADLTFNAIDVETANPTRASICQIGIAQIIKGMMGKPISLLVNPEEPFGQVQTNLHHISERTVRGAETLPSLYPRIQKLIEGTVLVSHSAFDRQALERAMSKYGLVMPLVRWLDSGKIAQAAWPEKYGKDNWALKNIAADLGITFQHHDAGEDARVAAEIVLRACRHTGLGIDDWLEQAGHQRRAPARPAPSQPAPSRPAPSRPAPSRMERENRLAARETPPSAGWPAGRPPGETPQQPGPPSWARALATILKLEESRGFNNRAVSGGLDRFTKRWDETIMEELGNRGVHRILLGIAYQDLSLEERPWWVEQWRGVMAERQKQERRRTPGDDRHEEAVR